MKHLIITLFTLTSSLLSLHAAIPLKWTVETSRSTPAQFEAYQGETLALEAALTSYGKPLEAPSNYSLYWQTNGMGSTYWSVPCVATASSPSNVLYATWSPTNDVGAKVYNCFIGQPGTIYHAAFQLRLRPSPGATPNELPLPTPVIDFAKVRVLNPPWPGGGGSGCVDTNAVIDIIRRTVDGSARALPPYLHYLEMDDTYPDAAEEFYRTAAALSGSCSSVRDGGFLSRNYDWNFDFMPEFVVRCVATASSPSCPAGRFASLAVCNVGTNLTEADVVSGKWSRWYKALPGHAVDGINENGVACNINVVSGAPAWGGGVSPALHPLAAIRWILDNATNAQQAATYIASHIVFPQGWSQNFHYMIADETSTYIVENGIAHLVPSASSPTGARAAMTNFRLYGEPSDTTGEGQERYVALTNGENITSQWWTLTYTPDGYRASDLPGLDSNLVFSMWSSKPRESHRGETLGGQSWWQTVHTSVYDLTNRVLRVCVQETPDWYTFTLRSDGVPAVDAAAVREIVRPMVSASTNNLRRVDDMAAYEVVRTENTDWTWESENAGLAKMLNDDGVTLTWDDDYFRVTPSNGVHWRFQDDYSIDIQNALSSTKLFEVDVDGDVQYKVATARRPRYMDETHGPSTNSALAAVATNGAGAVASGDIVKVGAGGRLVKATAGTDYLKDHQDISGKFDNTGGQITGNVLVLGDLEAARLSAAGEIESANDVFANEYGGDRKRHSLIAKADRSMISASDPTFSNAVSTVARTVTPPTSPTLRVYDDVRQCWWIGRMVNGVINWEVE